MIVALAFCFEKVSELLQGKNVLAIKKTIFEIKMAIGTTSWCVETSRSKLEIKLVIQLISTFLLPVIFLVSSEEI